MAIVCGLQQQRQQRSFLGEVQLSNRCLPKKQRPQRWLPLQVTAVVKRKKDHSLDEVIEREKKVKIVNRVKDLLVKQPGRVMSLMDLGKYKKHIGLPENRKLVTVLRKYPAVFKVFEEGACSVHCRLTPIAEEQYREEVQLRKQMENVLVLRLRKLLMMAVDRKILVRKLVHLKADLGLPPDFVSELVPSYPEHFKLVETEAGAALEVTSWDPELAVTYEMQKARTQDYGEISVSGRVPKFPQFDLPKGYKLPRKEMRKLLRFHETELVSPYEEARHLHPSSREAERRAVAVVQELLQLTLEKRTLVDHLTHFRDDFRFSQQVRGMLIRHPEVFYVSLKGQRDSVFLREAYNNSELIDKDPLVLAKEKLARLLSISVDSQRQDGDDAAADSDGSDWSDNEDLSDTAVFLRERRMQRELARALRPRVEPW